MFFPRLPDKADMTTKPNPYFPTPIQLAAAAWRDYGLSLELLREVSGSPLLPLRRLAERRRQRRPDRGEGAGRLNLLALLNTALRCAASRYLEARRCAVGLETVEVAGRAVPLPALRPTLEGFARHFPPGTVWAGTEAEAFLAAAESRRQAAVELFLLAVQTGNPAATPLADLFDDGELARAVPWRQTLRALDAELAQEPAAGLLGGSLLALLRAPIEASPGDLAGQLDWVRRHWGELLPPELLRAILIAFDVLATEEAERGHGPGAAAVLRFPRALEEPERFSPDTDWMPNVVLIAKTIYVWLDQLSKAYGRPIHRLDQIPEEELERLARRGFTALWLIGIWERSPASEKIKKIMGNPEAAPSAYSLYDYTVAADLGGEEALHGLEERCRRRGLRLGCDVVPNHTGLYSRWTREHPDWYIQTEHPPYPAYRFTGPDLSFSDDVELRIEDGYWNHSDAAVVFQHRDRASGRVRYLYHGNDGTHLPWNDTAQLNFLLPEVREAMIRTIIAVARRFPIIRFDAAMTLAKKHFQRLWFPHPGGGAGVPSRAEHALDPEAFEAAFPVEFWREVVDRVAAEVPDTLLLAEAFWLMEGYFVRTLGMHRVYNSAFMNMLKLEENAKYRTVLKNVLEFNPEILKRFVNFMNNPDEETAVAQFGKGDKYFGVAVLLATLPGLPMFGHGQIEGLEEKYGMEYRRAYRDERPDAGFVAHHEAQVFPLLRRRHLFSGAEHFVLFDFWSGGHVNEDVFAYSNRAGEERALVVVNNRHADTGGWVRTSTAKRVRDAAGERLVHPTLSEALALGDGAGCFWRFRDHRSGLEYLRPARELAGQGLHLQLGPYGYHVLLDWRQVWDDGLWGEVARRLNGRPCADLDRERQLVRCAPLHEALRHALQPELLAQAAQALAEEEGDGRPLLHFGRAAARFYAELARAVGAADESEKGLAEGLVADLAALGRLVGLSSPPSPPDPVLLCWLLLRRLGELGGAEGTAERTAVWLRELLLTDALANLLPEAHHAPLVALLCRHGAALAAEAERHQALSALFADGEARAFLGWHAHQERHYVNRERLETLVHWLFLAAALAAAEAEADQLIPHLTDLHGWCERLLAAAETAHYQLEKFAEFV
jgi:glycosidase